MGRVVITSLFFLFFLLLPMTIDASSISYNDLTVNKNFELNSQNFSDINLIIDNAPISFNQVTINYQTNDIINITVNHNSVDYNFSILLTRFDNARTSAGLTRSLVINDNFAVDDDNITNIVCSVYSEEKEILDVDVIKSSNSDGITDANLSCTSQYISSSSFIKTVNTNENSIYKFSGNNILYAENFEYNEDEIDSLSYDEIITLANVQSTYEDITITSIDDNIITLSSGDLSIQIEVLADEEPVFNKQRYYNLSYSNVYDVSSIFDITDDTDGELNIDIDLNEDVGIYVKKLKITDEAGNSIEDNVLIIINDGRYKITSDDEFILDTNYNTFYNDKDNYIDAYDIDELSYENVDATFFSNYYEDSSLTLNSDKITNQCTSSNFTNEEKKVNIFAYIIVLAIFALIFLL